MIFCWTTADNYFLIVVYQLAMILCLIAECISTYSLDKYEKLQDHVEIGYKGSHLYNNDLIDSEVGLIQNILINAIYDFVVLRLLLSYFVF